MKGGGGGGGDDQPQEMYIPPPAPVELPTTGWGGMGPTPTPQTFTQQATPSWMGPSPQGQPGMVPGQQQNWFAAPWWGTNAVTGEALGQDYLQVQPPPAPVVQQEVPNLLLEAIAEMRRPRRLRKRASQHSGRGGGFNEAFGTWYN